MRCKYDNRINLDEMDISTYHIIGKNLTNIYCPCILCNPKKNIRVNKPWYRYICCINNRK